MRKGGRAQDSSQVFKFVYSVVLLLLMVYQNVKQKKEKKLEQNVAEDGSMENLVTKNYI